MLASNAQTFAWSRYKAWPQLQVGQGDFGTVPDREEALREIPRTGSLIN
jgi:hypothetical protein